MKNKIIIFALFLFALGTVSAQAQDDNKNIIVKPMSVSVKPKLALKGAVAYEQDGKQYHKIILTITNRDKISPKMFELGEGEKLPPNPCREKGRIRVVLSVYGENGKQIASCMKIASAQSLEAPAFLIEKGKTVSEYVYIVLTDLKTGASVKSNLVSPFGGETK
jgi:hypothetical protein